MSSKHRFAADFKSLKRSCKCGRFSLSGLSSDVVPFEPFIWYFNVSIYNLNLSHLFLTKAKQIQKMNDGKRVFMATCARMRSVVIMQENNKSSLCPINSSENRFVACL